MNFIKKYILIIFLFSNLIIAQNYSNILNEITSKINKKIEFYNILGESVLEYNRRVYYYYIKRDSLILEPFKIKNSFGEIQVNKNNIKKINREINRIIRKNKLFKLNEDLIKVNNLEDKFLQDITQFSIYQEFNYRSFLDNTNSKFDKFRNEYIILDKELKKFRIQVENYQFNRTENELIKKTELMNQVRDSLLMGTVASTKLMLNELNENELDGDNLLIQRFENYINSLEKYYSLQKDLNFKTFTQQFYYTNKFLEEKTKISSRFNNHLVHLLATSSPDSPSFIDLVNLKINESNQNILFEQKPLIILDPFKLNRNNGFGKNRLIMPDSFVIILLDVSGSMNKNQRIEKCKEAIIKIIEEKTDKDYFSVIIFSGFSTILFNPQETDKNFQIEKIKQIKTFETTNPEEAILNSVSLLKKYTVSRNKNKVIMITDGGFSVTDPMIKAMYQIKAKRANFSLILLNGKKNSISELTNINNGEVYELNTSESIYKTLKQEILRE